jgi:hypothetical protein
MARRSRPPTGSTVKTASASTFAEWQAQAAAALESKHAIKAGTIPARVWTKLFLRGLSPEAAADDAATSAFNMRPASYRLKGRG